MLQDGAVTPESCRRLCHGGKHGRRAPSCGVRCAAKLGAPVGNSHEDAADGESDGDWRTSDRAGGGRGAVAKLCGQNDREVGRRPHAAVERRHVATSTQAGQPLRPAEPLAHQIVVLRKYEARRAQQREVSGWRIEGVARSNSIDERGNRVAIVVTETSVSGIDDANHWKVAIPPQRERLLGAIAR